MLPISRWRCSQRTALPTVHLSTPSLCPISGKVIPSSRSCAAFTAICWYSGGSRVSAIGISTCKEAAVRILRDRVHHASFSAT